MATSASHTAATFWEVAGLVKDIGTAAFRICPIINQWCVLENATSFSDSTNVAPARRCGDGEGLSLRGRSCGFLFRRLQCKKVASFFKRS